MSEYICQQLCSKSLTTIAEQEVSSALHLSEPQLDGSETLLLCLLTGLAFAMFIYAYRERRQQMSRCLITKQLQTQILVTPPNPNADTMNTLDLSYTFHQFNSASDRTVVLPNGSTNGQWLILMNKGTGRVSLPSKYVDGRNVPQSGILLDYGSSGQFVWNNTYWSDVTVGFSILSTTSPVQCNE